MQVWFDQLQKIDFYGNIECDSKYIQIYSGKLGGTHVLYRSKQTKLSCCFGQSANRRELMWENLLTICCGSM